jgi:hypothetical protein
LGTKDLTLSLRRMSSLIHASNVEAKLEELARVVETKYDPNQPRVPAGNPDGGQWTETGAGSATNSTTKEESLILSGLRRISSGLEDLCGNQYMRDVFQCRMVGLRACYEQAALRYSNCLVGRPIPPLNY